MNEGRLLLGWVVVVDGIGAGVFTGVFGVVVVVVGLGAAL